jgi:hypothetical protein
MLYQTGISPSTLKTGHYTCRIASSYVVGTISSGHKAISLNGLSQKGRGAQDPIAGSMSDMAI